MTVAAIDQGTSSTRLLLINDDGSAEVRLTARHRQHHPQPGWVEHDPLELLANVRRCVDAAKDVAAIGLANQGESCLAWDAKTGEPLSPVLVWKDNRTISDILRMRSAGCEALTLERSGLPLDPYFSASKLAWIVNNIPAARRAWKSNRLRLGTTDSYFLDRLTGSFSTDVTTASRTSLLNLSTGQWDPDLCAMFGVPIETLPSIRDSVAHFGCVGSVPILCSIVDQQASLYGHGCTQVGNAKVTFGTGAFALAVTGSEIVRAPDKGLLPTVAWQLDGTPTYAVDGGVYDASSAVEWARGLGLFGDFSELATFEAAPAVSRDLVFVPALSGLACPHWDRSAAAMWLGMDGGTTRRDMCQAVLEGVALRGAEVILAMDHFIHITDRLSIDGGLSRSPYFAQFFADVTQRSIVTQRFDELTALGCAALAARGLGVDLRLPPNIATEFHPQVAAKDAMAWLATFKDGVQRCRGWR